MPGSIHSAGPLWEGYLSVFGSLPALSRGASSPWDSQDTERAARSYTLNIIQVGYKLPLYCGTKQTLGILKLTHTQTQSLVKLSLSPCKAAEVAVNLNLEEYATAIHVASLVITQTQKQHCRKQRKHFVLGLYLYTLYLCVPSLFLCSYSN